ncbi:MAG TPA: substrate-binding domain-containing protein, partial [Armatimonadota bacterium]
REEEDVISCLLADSEPPTALITSDGFAAELIQRAGPRGVRIPHDISIVGSGNLPFAEKLSPPLTTVEQHPIEVGRRAVALFLRRLAEGHCGSDFTPEIIRIPAELVIRHTCDKPRPTRKIVPKHLAACRAK